ncbi:MAG: TldD/PmbA family protein [Gammaproteobacteria bacterium]|nr:TldD/PmbA family protein [Gammaproteobacteria bacterium]
MSLRDHNLSAYSNRFDAYTELRLQRNANLRISLLNGDVVANAKSADSGVSARVFREGVWGFASRAEIEADAVTRTLADAGRNAALLARHAARPDVTLPTARAKHAADFTTRKPRATQTQMIDFLRAIDDRIAQRYPALKSRSVTLADLDMEKRLFTSDQSDGYSNTTRSLILIRLVTTNARGQPVELGHSYGGRGQFEDVFKSPSDLDAQIDALYAHLVKKADAVAPRAGVHDVILDSELAGILAHEAIGHTTEADLVQEGSVAGDFLGQMVASPLITMVDFANTHLGETLPVPVYVDDEGVESRDTVLIENGVLKNFMHNKESAGLFGVPATGNARAYQFFDEPLIRMRNTAILPGTDKLERMIASIEDGYYLMWPSNGQADSTSEFMFGVTLGYEIKHGQLGRAITDTTIAGVAFDMLKTVTMVSDEMSWSCAGMCGKKQIIPVGMGGPSIKCRIHIGGE